MELKIKAASVAMLAMILLVRDPVCCCLFYCLLAKRMHACCYLVLGALQIANS